MGEKIHSFTDLHAWQEAHRLGLDIYRVTKDFPKEGVFTLTSQMRRCAISISSNSAEGFSRSTGKDKLQFYTIALGSTTELQSQLIMARDLGYVSHTHFKEIADRTVVVHKLINGLMKSAKGRHDT